jgi:hypothetical protein
MTLGLILIIRETDFFSNFKLRKIPTPKNRR